MVQLEPWLSVGVASDQYSNQEQALYQAMHNQIVAAAEIKNYARSLNNPNIHIGTMVADGTVYPASSKPDDVILAMQQNRMQYFVTDVQYYDRYQKPIIIAENGLGAYDKLENDKKVHDPYRSEYLSMHIEQVGRAIHDGAEVIAYCAWGPIDIVSCSSQQMSKRYGFVYVDIDDNGKGTKKRYLKDSYFWYKQVINSNGKYI